MLITSRNYRLSVRHYEAASPSLPEHRDGHRICFLSDLHIGSIRGLDRLLFDTLAGLTVDTLVLGGDYFDERYPRDEWPGFARQLAAAAGDSADRVFAVFGNHDCPSLSGIFRDAGIPDIESLAVNISKQDGNEGAGLTIRGVPFNRRGLDDLRSGPPPAARNYNILLTHSPDFAAAAEARGYDLFLCGHTHAGQICLPGGGMIMRSARAPRRICARDWTLGRMAGYTSPGIGTSVLPVRLYCEPEIAVLTLRRAPERSISSSENPAHSAPRTFVSSAN